jgi:hypothetical protein
MAPFEDPILACTQRALLMARENRRGWERDADGCTGPLRQAAAKFPETLLTTALVLLESALMMPLARRRIEVIDALRACRKVMRSGRL